jgi:hypothetical protein
MEAKRTATDQDDKPMLQKIKLILDNLKELEDKRVVSKTDNYVSFLRDVARVRSFISFFGNPLLTPKLVHRKSRTEMNR